MSLIAVLISLGLLFLGLVVAVALLATPLFFQGAPFVTSDAKTIQQILELGKITQGMRIVDLGSGDGRIVAAAAQAGADAIGYETNPWLVIRSRQRLRQNQLTGRIVWQNFWRVSVAEADLVIVYLLPHYLGRLEKKLAQELAPTARVISIAFPLPHWPVMVQQDKVFVYKRPGIK